MLRSLKNIIAIGLLVGILLGVILMVLKIAWALLSAPSTVLIRILGITYTGVLLFIVQLLITLGIVLVLGFILNFWRVGQRITRIPIIGEIIEYFFSIKDILKNGKFILVELWDPNTYAIALTSLQKIEEINRATGKELIGVAINSFPVPGTGALMLFIPRNKITIVEDMTPKMWIQLIISATLLKPGSKLLEKIQTNGSGKADEEKSNREKKQKK